MYADLTADRFRQILPVLNGKGNPDMARVLVADDNSLSLEFFAEAIARCGHVADIAKDGMDACLLASARRYDLMIIDARMPLRSGRQTLLAIRAGDGPSRESRAIATTADAALDPVELLNAGFFAVVHKPIALDVFRDLLEVQLATPSVATRVLNDRQALAQVGGDSSIMAALRGLLAAELDALPAELSDYAADNNVQALRDRLHRLDASAGFCGATRLAGAAQELRHALDLERAWPDKAVSALLRCSAETRALLGQR